MAEEKMKKREAIEIGFSDCKWAMTTTEIYMYGNVRRGRRKGFAGKMTEEKKKDDKTKWEILKTCTEYWKLIRVNERTRTSVQRDSASD